MSWTANCPGCSLTMGVGEDLMGRDIKCPSCGTVFFSGSTDPEPVKQKVGKRANRKFSPLIPAVIAGVLALFAAFFLLFAFVVMPTFEKAQNRVREIAAQRKVDRPNFVTALKKENREAQRAPRAPSGLFDTIKYESPKGPMTAYVGVDPGDGRKHPAIIWIFGGFSNGIGDTAWVEQSPDNDQSASAFREAGIVMMYPSLRGGNDSPGYQEAFLGEVDDVLAAADHLAKLPYVDPGRIYLGGHSTGGTLVLLCASFSDRFRATLALGPVDDIAGYGEEALPFDVWDNRELLYRNPINWIDSVPNKTIIIEGSQGNADCVTALKRGAAGNENVECHIIGRADHFGIIAPVTRLMAKKIVEDTTVECKISFSSAELNK